VSDNVIMSMTSANSVSRVPPRALMERKEEEESDLRRRRRVI
jgi:hypothetical protein